jgi:hypothetical protein
VKPNCFGRNEAPTRLGAKQKSWKRKLDHFRRNEDPKRLGTKQDCKNLKQIIKSDRDLGSALVRQRTNASHNASAPAIEHQNKQKSNISAHVHTQRKIKRSKVERKHARRQGTNLHTIDH